jgi:hypothetical protein
MAKNLQEEVTWWKRESMPYQGFGYDTLTLHGSWKWLFIDESSAIRTEESFRFQVL